MRAAQDGIPNSFLLDSGIAGQLESGMPVEDVYRLLGPQNVAIESTFPEGMFQPVLRITLPGSPATPAIIAEIESPRELRRLNSLNQATLACA